MNRPVILVVDDEERNIKLLKAMLSLENYELIGAQHGEEALDLVARKEFDLILLDVMMPGLDGFEVCRRIKENEKTRAVPVVMVTALREKEHRIHALEAGADDFISKPVDQTELFLRVKSLLRIKTYHDDLRRNYSELAEMHAKLRELEKAKEGLTHMVIHDLSTPLMAISSIVQLVLMDKGAFSAKQVQFLQTSLDQCQDLNRQIQSLLDIHRMEEAGLKLQREPAEMADIVKEILSQFSSRAFLKGISLTFELVGQIPAVSLDQNLIGRVVSNLLSNALRYTPTGGSIQGSVDFKSEQRLLRITIRDTGPGLDPEYHERVFDKFEQVSMKKAGVIVGMSGVGLTFCKMAVDAHGGRIWVESEGKGKGCVFNVEIPG
ncbi:MAG: hybrid sensor histidine kinase/response regulator [Desulfobacteraceae bacterium]|nr:MAG: hybrid sensor histidine kinase/response regulator [Desulfobacteraceae bacterium]